MMNLAGSARKPRMVLGVLGPCGASLFRLPDADQHHPVLRGGNRLRQDAVWMRVNRLAGLLDSAKCIVRGVLLMSPRGILTT
jgi:hypothetical protein